MQDTKGVKSHAFILEDDVVPAMMAKLWKSLTAAEKKGLVFDTPSKKFKLRKSDPLALKRLWSAVNARLEHDDNLEPSEDRDWVDWLRDFQADIESMQHPFGPCLRDTSVLCDLDQEAMASFGKDADVALVKIHELVQQSSDSHEALVKKLRRMLGYD